MAFPKNFYFSQARMYPAKFPAHSVSSSFVPPAPAAPEIAPEDGLVAAPVAPVVAPREGERTPSPGDDSSPNPEAASIFKEGPRNAAEPPSDAAVESWIKKALERNQVIDQALLPKSHLLHHDTKDSWHKVCTTCRAGVQRRKAAKSGSTDLEVRQVSKTPFGSCVRLDTEDCHLEALDESLGDMQYFDGLRYDLIAVDSGTGWNFSTPITDKRTTTVKKDLRLARSNN